MKKWLKNIRDAAVMGFIWAVQWAVLAVLIGTISELVTGYSIEKHLDPLVALAMPGFIVGVIFYTVILFVEKDSRFVELSFLRVMTLGALVGLLLGALAFTLGTPKSPVWLTVVIIVCSSTLLSAVSAVGAGLLFRLVSRQQPPADLRTEG